MSTCSVCGETDFGWGYCPACGHPNAPAEEPRADRGDDDEDLDDDEMEDDEDEGEFLDDVGWGP